MEAICNLAETGVSTGIFQIIAIVVLIVVILFVIVPSRYKSLLLALIVFLSLGGTILSSGGRAQAASEDCNATVVNTANDVVEEQDEGWLPEGRFQSAVFDQGDIVTEQIAYGTQANFAGSSETIYMTINRPSSSVDPETSRPVVVALTGGDTAGFCDSSFAAEQAAMLKLATLGYVTVTLTPLLNNDFCDGEPEASYYENFDYNRFAADKAITYLKDNATTYRIDPERIALYGYSIGGQVALMQIRQNYTSSPSVKMLIGFSAIAQDNVANNTAWGTLVPATGSSPSIYMLSFQPDIGFAPGVDPDAEADCNNLVSLGYDCTFKGIPVPGHAVHPNTLVGCDFLAGFAIDCNTLGFPVVDNNVSVPAEFEPVLYQKLVVE